MKRLLLAGLLIVSLTLSLHVIRTQGRGAPDFPEMQISSQSEEVTIEIPVGSTGSEIAKLLFDSGVTKSSLAFFRVAVADSRSGKIAPGGHRLTQQISARQALEQLLDPKRIPNLFVVSEGAWNSEIFSELRNRGFTKQELSKAISSLVLPPGFSSLEGLLFPAQYSFPSDVSATEILQSMVDRFAVEASASGLDTSTDKYSPTQLLVIASIIQAEADLADFAKVSQVIRNRLSIGMPLQMDSTVHYIRKVRGEIFLSTKATLAKSPYNTYTSYI